MKHPVKTLAALAILGAMAPSAYAVSIKDDAFSVKLGGNVQFRASLLNDAQADGGGDYDPLRGAAGQSAEDLRFEIRRARVSFAAKWGDWFGNITLRSEKNDQGANATSTGNNAGGNGRPVQLYYAKLGRDFKVGDMTHQIRLGLDKSFNAESSQSSSTFLFPTDTIVNEKVEERAVGVGYMFMMPFINFGVDLHNNSTGTKDPDANNVDFGETNGYFYSLRLEFAPGAEFMPAKRMESFYGKEGTHLVIGLDAQWDNDSMSTNGASTPNAAGLDFSVKDTFTWGPDVLFHWNGVTAKAEYRARTTKQEDTDLTVNGTVGTTTTLADAKAQYWDIQVAYAFPLDDVVIEPAAGYMVNDANKDVDSNASYGAGADNGADGKTVNIGVNFYWNGHDNKTQIAYQNWKAETGDADASIIRIQHQVNF